MRSVCIVELNVTVNYILAVAQQYFYGEFTSLARTKQSRLHVKASCCFEKKNVRLLAHGLL